MTGILGGLALLAGGAWGLPVVVALAALVVLAWLAGADAKNFLIACTLLAGLAAIRIEQPKQREISAWLGTAQSFDAVVVGAPIDNGIRQSFVVRAVPAEVATSESPERVCISAPALPRVNRGDRLLLEGEPVLLAEATDRTAGYLRYRGCVALLNVSAVTVAEEGEGVPRLFDRVRRRMSDALLIAAPGDAGALLAGLATGDDVAMTAAQRDAFVATGTSHVTAVSGSNLSLLIAMLALGSSTTRTARSPWRWTVFLGGIWTYVALVGWSPPATRAAAVATLALFARGIGRRPDFVTLAVVAAAVEVAVRPTDLNSLAFRLSTVSAISLVLGLGGRSPSGATGWLVHGIAATAVTQAATAALLVPVFGRLSVYAIPANLLIGPLCTAAFPFALLAGLVGIWSPALAAAFGFPGRLMADLVLGIVSFFARLPYADAGGHLSVWLPPWVWLIGGVAAVVAMSRECRGGIRFRMRIARSWDGRKRVVSLGALAGACAGSVIAMMR